MREKIREVIGDVGRGSQHKTLLDPPRCKSEFDICTVNGRITRDLERKPVQNAHHSHGACAIIFNTPFLSIGTISVPLLDIRSWSHAAVANIESFPGERNIQRISPVAVRGNMEGLGARPVPRIQLNICPRLTRCAINIETHSIICLGAVITCSPKINGVIAIRNKRGWLL